MGFGYIVLRQEVAQLCTENEGLRQENERLAEQLGVGQSGVPPTFVKANRARRERAQRRKRAAKDNGGRRRMALTRYEVHEIEICPECGERLTQGLCYYRREAIDIPPP